MTDTEKYSVNVRDIYISDPCVLACRETGMYYIYARSFDRKMFPEVVKGATFYCMESPDLINWSRPILVFEKPDDFWADLDYWAPECHFYKGRYYIISSFRAEGRFRRCQALVSDSPTGSFAPVSDAPLTPENWQCLDGTLYIDREGRPWLVFCHEWLQVWDGQMCCVRLSDDLSAPIGDPTVLFYASDAPWCAGAHGEVRGQVTDGCFTYRTRSGALLMLWSNFCAGGYAIGCAKSDSGEITGPWTQYEQPLWAMDGGHAMLFHTFDGQLMMAFHCNNTDKRMMLCQMAEQGDRLRIVNEITGNWYNKIGGGFVAPYGYKDKCKETAAFTAYNMARM